MEVSFNQLRLNTQAHYNELISIIHDHYNEVEDGGVLIDSFDIPPFQRCLSALHADIATLMCVYTPKPEIIDNISAEANLKIPDLF